MHGRASTSDAPDFLAGGGATGTLLRAHDWTSSPLGDPAAWPQALKTLAAVMLGSQQPMLTVWGPEHTTLYNDGYALMCGVRHPAALGRPFDDLWHDIWDQVGPILSRAYAGESTHMDDIAFAMHRNGYPEEPHFAFGYTPVRDETGRVAGMFCACQETTGQVLAERRSVAERERLRQLFEQAPGFMAMLRGPEHVFELVNPAYMQLVGYRDVIGKPARQALPEVEGQGFFELLDGVYAKGEAFKRSALKVGLQRAAHARRARRGALRRSRLSARNGCGRQRHRHLRRGLRRHGAGACRGIHAGIPRGREAFTRRVLESLTDCIKVLSLDARLEFLSAGGLGVMEIDDFGQFEGAYWPDFWRGEENRKVLDAVAEARAGRTGRFQGYTTTAKGNMRYWDVIVTPILGRDGASEKLLAISRDISVQRRTEEALREREERLRLVVEGAKDHAIFTSDPRGVITSWSAGAEEIFGWTAAEAVGEPAALTFLPEDRVAGVDEVELAKAACDGCAPDERWHLRKDGGRVFMNGSVHPLPRDAQGREQGFLKIARDETERRRSDDVLRESEEHYRHAAELNPQVAWTATPDGQLDRVAERWREWTGSSGLGQSWGEGLHPDDLAYTVDAWSRSVATGVLYDVEHRVKMLSGGYRWARSWAFPRRDAAGRIVKWYGATEDVHERRLAEERLRTSEARLSAFLSQASAGIASTDREGRFTFVNDRYCELLGRSRESLLAGRMQDVTHPDDLAENVPLFMAAVEGGPAFAFEKRYVRPDGTVVWVHNSVTAIRDAHGAFESILAVSVDITDRKAAEAALRESEAHFRNVADHAPMMMRVTDPSGACTYLNRLWYEFTGQSEAEALGLGWIKATHPDDDRLAADAFLSANAAQVPFRVEYRLRRAEGAYRWVIDAAPPRFGPSGEFLGYVGSVIDIDERKEIETALRLRGEEFYVLADNIPSLCWIAYANGDIFWHNRRWYEYTGTTPESQAGWGWQSVHDREVLPAIVARWTYSIDTGEPFEMTFPLKGADGVFRPFLTRIVPIRDGTGTIVRWFGTNVDISQQREAEIELEQRVEERTRERDQLWDLSEDLLAVADYEGHLLRASPSWTRLLGYDQETLLTRPYGDIIHSDDLGATMDALLTMRATCRSASRIACSPPTARGGGSLGPWLPNPAASA